MAAPRRINFRKVLCTWRLFVLLLLVIIVFQFFIAFRFTTFTSVDSETAVNQHDRVSFTRCQNLNRPKFYLDNHSFLVLTSRYVNFNNGFMCLVGVGFQLCGGYDSA